MLNYAGAPRAWHGPFGLPPLLVQARPAPPFLSAMPVILPYIAPLLLLLETNTEAKVAAAVARGEVAVALSRTQERPDVAPGTTPPDPKRARGRSGGINHRVAGGISCTIPVCRPFPDISVHIKKAPWVGRVLGHISSLA